MVAPSHETWIQSIVESASGILAAMRGWRLAAVVLPILLLAASVSVTRPYTLEIVDEAGRPLRAYALYKHQGSRPNFVHPVSYDATPLTPVRGDAEGRLTFPLKVHLHRPFPIETHPALWVEMVYVPGLHNAGGRLGGGYAASAPGTWEMDERRRRAVVFDLSGDPEGWQGTLSTLSFVLRPLLFGPERERDPETDALLGELVAHFRAEYDAFLLRWGDVPRQRPAMPLLFSEEDKRQWAKTVDADLARHPTWGMEVRSRFEDEIAALREIEAAGGR